ncbi:MAG TPA: transcriptional repressor LexA [Candidatus Omnitrophota bacterium]|nr:transcriptional repressor LexA [Candidatus Omnitrophota bacterium]HQO58485.1 transcriptional repressor LexA [Candidatus Omnitrophota bacterium]HQP12167.1 transcriptional repressor LexA [Candidatus Omnitrophota bacterium]
MNKNSPLTEKQKDVFKFIYKRIRLSHLPPTVREIAEQFGFSSTGTVRDYLHALVEKGYIRISANKSRAIEIIKENFFQIPILGRVQAGLPTLAVEEIEGYLDLDSLVFSDNNTFALRVRGDSMNGAGIFPDDLVLVKRQPVAQTGEIVVALIRDDATVKYLRKRGRNYFLEPANPQYEPIPVNEDVMLIGKVISVIRKLN